MKKIIDKNFENLKNKFKKYFLDSINHLKNNDRIVIWLSWWNSLKIFYEELKNNFHLIDKTLRNKIYFCFLDERVVDFSNDNSNYKSIKKIFLDKLLNKWLIKQEQILLPDFSLKDYEINYFEKVKKIDIWFFWVWEDCHTCSLFPNHKLLKNEEYWYLKIIDSPKQPKERITISINMLLDIKYAYVFFMWKEKEKAFNIFKKEEVNNNDCPIKFVEKCENVIIFSDLV